MGVGEGEEDSVENPAPAFVEGLFADVGGAVRVVIGGEPEEGIVAAMLLEFAAKEVAGEGYEKGKECGGSKAYENLGGSSC